MHKDHTHKELYDPFTHYARGMLRFDDDRFTFIAYRVPYVGLNEKTWKTEQAFNADYQAMVARKYAV